MERMENEDLIKAADRKSVAQARETLSKIGKGDDKIDTSKMTIKPNTAQQDLIRAYRFKNNVPARVSDADVLKMINQGTPAKNKKGAAKLPKKSIMELPTNVPRLMKGALLGDLNKDGKMSGYETARQKAITKSMEEQKTKKAKSGLAVGIANIKKAKEGKSISKVVDSFVKDAKKNEKSFLKKMTEKQKKSENYKKTMGFEHGDTRSPKTKARVKSLFKPSVPETTKLADSGFISQGHQLKQLGRKLQGKKYKQYKDKAYKKLVKGT